MNPTVRHSTASIVWAASLLVIGSLSLSAAWSGPWPALFLGLAAVAPMLVLRGVIRLGVSRWATATVMTLLLVLLAYLLSAHSDTTFTGTVTNVLPLLLSEPQPLAVRADLLAAPILATGMTGVLVGLRLAGPARVAPVVGAAILHVSGLLLTAGGSDPYGLLAALLLVLALAGWALLDEHADPVRLRLPVLAPLAALAVAVAAIAAAFPSDDPFDPRTLVSSPVTTVAATNPLPQLGAWAANPRLELMRVDGPEVPLRLVTLDDYDGAQWSSATRFAKFGTEGSPALPPGTRQQEITEKIDVIKLVGQWLPSAGQPVSISEPDALLDPGTGSIHLPDRGDRVSYSVTALRDAPDRSALTGASVPTRDDLAPFLAVPDLPYSLAEYSRAATRGAASPYDRALAIEAAVRGNRKFSTSSISGSAYWRIERFLLGKKGTPGAQKGTSEQFATAFAIVARQNGLPTRIVVGFRPGEENPDGTRTVHGEDALAWPEVYFEGLGWVPFSPLPDDSTFGHDDVDSAPLETKDPSPTQTTEPTPGQQTSPHPTPAKTPPTDAPDDSGRTWVWAVPVLLVLVPLLLLWLLRRLRTLRHRRHGPRGAWAEVLDALSLLGAPVRPHESATDVARRVERLLGDARVLGLAAAAEASAFGPPALSPAWPDGADDVRRAARRQLPLWRRAWWWFDPRPLLRSRHS